MTAMKCESKSRLLSGLPARAHRCGPAGVAQRAGGHRLSHHRKRSGGIRRRPERQAEAHRQGRAAFRAATPLLSLPDRPLWPGVSHRSRDPTSPITPVTRCGPTTRSYYVNLNSSFLGIAFETQTQRAKICRRPIRRRSTRRAFSPRCCAASITFRVELRDARAGVGESRQHAGGLSHRLGGQFSVPGHWA